jgi:predicted PurR-regulated permease PerM
MRFLPPYMADSTTSLMNRLTFTLNSYLRGQIKLSGIMFLITTSSLLFLNMLGATIPGFGFHIGPYLILGLLAGITEVIPIVGPLIAFTPALILGFLDSTTTGITVIVLYGLIQFAEGNILVPKIMGRKLDVHPLTVMFALLCGGLLGGIGGMLLALPAAATLKVMFDQYYPEFIISVENLIMEKKKEPDSKAPAS